MPLTLIEESVFPICHFEMKGDLADAKRLIGSGFFINRGGIFLTAGHVAQAFSGIKPGLFFKPDPVGQPNLNRVAWIQEYEIGPSDLAVGRVEIGTHTFFDRIGTAEGIWADVVACGYAESAVLLGGDRFKSPIRGLKGYIQRAIADGLENDIPVEGKIYELNFPIPRGMSGSPLYRVREGAVELVGVCVASHTAEMVDFEHVSVDDNGATYNERKIRVEQYGIATAIESALNWTPTILGQPLRDLVVAG